MSDANFQILCMKPIYAVLDGDTVLGECEEYRKAMPYRSGTDLVELCKAFGLEEKYGASRWVYIEDLIKHTIDENRCNELLKYLFDEGNFEGLSVLGSPEEFDSAYKSIVEATINKINSIIRMTKHELQIINSDFYMVECGKKPCVQTKAFNLISMPYVHGLKVRCEQDFVSKNYDSVITKSRTLIEEVLIHILEENAQQTMSNGDINKLYNEVKTLFGMQQSKDYDRRVNGLLGGLEKIVNAVAEMRNNDSDAHGVGNGRISIRECEAQLVMNSSISFCEYYLGVKEMYKTKK